MEKWKLYDENNQTLGKVVNRGDSLEEGEYYRVVGAVILNQEGKILIPRRSKEKESYPDFLEITCGSLYPDEEPIRGMQREIQEETGLKVEKEALDFLGILKQKNKFTYMYLLQVDAKDEDLVLQKEEVAEAAFYSKEDFLKIFFSQGYAPPMKERLEWAYPHYIDKLK